MGQNRAQFAPTGKTNNTYKNRCGCKEIRPALPDDGSRTGKLTPTLIPVPRSQERGRSLLCSLSAVPCARTAFPLRPVPHRSALLQLLQKACHRPSIGFTQQILRRWSHAPPNPGIPPGLFKLIRYYSLLRYPWGSFCPGNSMSYRFTNAFRCFCTEDNLKPIFCLSILGRSTATLTAGAADQKRVQHEPDRVQTEIKDTIGQPKGSLGRRLILLHQSTPFHFTGHPRKVVNKNFTEPHDP